MPNYTKYYGEYSGGKRVFGATKQDIINEAGSEPVKLFGYTGNAWEEAVSTPATLATPATPATPKTPASPTTTPTTPATSQKQEVPANTQSGYLSLIDIWSARPDLQKEFPSKAQGASGSWTLNDWWNKYGRYEYPNITLTQSGDKRIDTSLLSLEGAKEEPKQGVSKTLMQIYNERTDLQEQIKESFPGQDPFIAGTQANTWLNDWWNTAGKHEYPDINLVPGAEEEDVIQTSEAAKKEDVTKDEDKVSAKDLQLDELTNLQNQVTIESLREQLGLDKKTGMPSDDKMVSTYGDLRNKYGMVALESQLSDVNKQIADIEASAMLGIQKAEDRLAPMELIGSEQSAIQKQANQQLYYLQNKKQAIVDELNTKNNVINTLMNLTQQDYANAKDAYDTAFTQNMQMLNYIDDQQDELVASAKANLETITNAITTAGKSWDDLDVSLQSQIASLEAKAGLPQGVTRMFSEVQPEAEILSTTTSYDAAGNQIVSFIYKDKDGNPGAVEVVKTGGYKKPSSGSLSTEEKNEAKNQEWIDAEKYIEDNPNLSYEELLSNIDRDTKHLTNAEIKNILAGKNRLPKEEEKEEEKFLSKDYFLNAYGEKDLKKKAKEAGYTKGGGFLGIGVGKEGLDEYLDYLMGLVEQYRDANYTDKEILKMMT